MTVAIAGKTPIHALVQAVFKAKPPVLSNVKVNTDPDHIPSVTMTFVLTPELVKAWADECRVEA